MNGGIDRVKFNKMWNIVSTGKVEQITNLTRKLISEGFLSKST